MATTYGKMNSPGPDRLTPPSHESRSVAPPYPLWISLLALSFFYLALISVELRRPLWFDELLTYYIARAASLSQLLYLVKKWDLNPPVVHLLAHWSLNMFHGRLVATRFPSVVEFYFASILFYLYSRRKLTPAFAPLPVLIFWFSPMFRFAAEARPYALLLFWFACLLLLWDAAASVPRRPLVLLALALANVGLLNSHFFAVFALLPFLIAEAVRCRINRRPDYAVWAALLLPLSLLFVYLPFYTSFRSVVFFPAAFQASLHTVAAFYWNTFRSASAALLIAALAAGLAVRHNLVWNRLSLRSPDAALLFSLSLAPLLLALVLMQLHAPFWGRYVLCSVFALYFLFSIYLAAVFRHRSRPAHLAVFAVSLLLLLWRVAIPVFQARVHPRPQNAAALLSVRPRLPIVAASGLTFVEMGQYEDPRLLSRLFYLRDRAAAIRYAHATLFEDLSDYTRQFALPGTVEPYAEFLHQHHAFLVLASAYYPEDWLLAKLRADGARIALLGCYDIPYKDHNLYLVQSPEGKADPAFAAAAGSAHGNSKS